MIIIKIMERIFYFILLGLLFVVGCDNSSTNDAEIRSKSLANNNVKNVNNNSSSEINVYTNKNITEKELSIIEKAQKEYQDSYNEYVKSLRESGPQTIETLQALTIYQKKYQIYQMLLKAESQK